MRKAVAIWAWVLFVFFASLARAGTEDRQVLWRGLCLLWAAEFDAGYERWRRRRRHLRIQRDRCGRPRGHDGRQPGRRITVGSVGGSYHFLCCHYKRKGEPFVGAGYSYLSGTINTHGYVYPFDPGQDRTGPYFNQGLIAWPLKHFGVRFEVREYRMFVGYGALENVIPGGKFVEFHIAVTLR